MKSLLIFAALFAASIASAQTKAVLKNINGGTITESLTIGSGKTLTIASGATINATGATITGFTAAAAWGGITGTITDQADLQSALDLKATLASPTFSGNVTLPTNLRLLDTVGDNYARLYIADNLAANYDISISLASATTLAFNGAVAFGGAFTTDGSVGFTGTSSTTFALPSSTARTYTLPTASSTLLAINGDGSGLTGITPSQLAQASAASGQVLAWSGTAWAPATATGGVTSITGTTNQITVTGTTTPTLSLASTVSVSALNVTGGGNAFSVTGNIAASSVGIYPYIALSYPAGQISLASSTVLSWASVADYTASKDAGIGRNAAGKLEINSGTPGTLRDLALRSLFATTGVTIGSSGTASAVIKHGTATLTAGTVTVSDSDVVAGSLIFINRQTDGGTLGDSYSITRSAGVSFTITSKTANATASSDTSTVSYLIVNP